MSTATLKFADFIFTASRQHGEANDPYHDVFVIETKGLHLKLNADTNYKRSVQLLAAN